jgi:hypothetical protein
MHPDILYFQSKKKKNRYGIFHRSKKHEKKHEQMTYDYKFIITGHKNDTVGNIVCDLKLCTKLENNQENHTSVLILS